MEDFLFYGKYFSFWLSDFDSCYNIAITESGCNIYRIEYPNGRPYFEQCNIDAEIYKTISNEIEKQINKKINGKSNSNGKRKR